MMMMMMMKPLPPTSETLTQRAYRVLDLVIAICCYSIKRIDCASCLLFIERLMAHARSTSVVLLPVVCNVSVVLCM